MAMAVSTDLYRMMGALSVKNKVPESAHVFVDTPVSLVCALDVIGDEIVIAVDCEGVNLGRYCFHMKACMLHHATACSGPWSLSAVRVESCLINLSKPHPI